MKPWLGYLFLVILMAWSAATVAQDNPRPKLQKPEDKQLLSKPKEAPPTETESAKEETGKDKKKGKEKKKEKKAKKKRAKDGKELQTETRPTAKKAKKNKEKKKLGDIVDGVFGTVFGIVATAGLVAPTIYAATTLFQ